MSLLVKHKWTLQSNACVSLILKKVCLASKYRDEVYLKECYFYVYVHCVSLQRLEKLSLKWDIAKNDVRQDQHQILKDKVLLQQQLIKKQDALAQAKRDEMEKEACKVWSSNMLTPGGSFCLCRSCEQSSWR